MCYHALTTTDMAAEDSAASQRCEEVRVEAFTLK